MWSKKKRKKEAKGESNIPPSSKQQKPQEGEGSNTVVNRVSDPSSPSLSTDNHQRSGSHPPSSRLICTSSSEPKSIAKPHISVPLPSAPLPTASILESLTSSLKEGVALGGNGNSASASVAPLQLKKVIAEAQRSLINQITQTLEQGAGGRPSDSSGNVISGRLTQTFDYDNQSNKEFEIVAVQRLEQDYCRGDQSWNT